MMQNQHRKILSITAELQILEQKERSLAQAARRAKPAGWKAELESRIPGKVFSGLESAFCKGFAMVFEQGRTIIEKSYHKEAILADHAVRDYGLRTKGGRKELKQMDRSVRQADLVNMAATTVEGVGLGALGIGMPDIVLFLALLLKGVYETALHYGYDYESPQERMLILKMMAAALSSGEDWVHRNEDVDGMLEYETVGITEEDLAEQMKITASAFAVDMLLLKFIQGLPVVGIVGGAANPVYYRKVMRYVQLKYQKRYLWKQMEIPVQ